AEDLRPHPHATVTLRPNPADPAEVTVEAESDDMNPAHVAYGLRMAADRFNGHAITQGHQPIPYGAAAEAAATVARLVQERGERMEVDNALRDEAEELRARVAELEAAAQQPTTPRILTTGEYENAYAAARGELGRYRAQLGSAIVADTVTSTLAAVGLIAPPPAPEPDTCPAQFADREGAWHQCEDEPGHDPAAGHNNGEWSWPDGVWFARPDEDDDARPRSTSPPAPAHTCRGRPPPHSSSPSPSSPPAHPSACGHPAHPAASPTASAPAATAPAPTAPYSDSPANPAADPTAQPASPCTTSPTETRTCTPSPPTPSAPPSGATATAATAPSAPDPSREATDHDRTRRRPHGRTHHDHPRRGRQRPVGRPRPVRPPQARRRPRRTQGAAAVSSTPEPKQYKADAYGRPTYAHADVDGDRLLVAPAVITDPATL